MSDIDFATVEAEMRKGRAEDCRAFLGSVPEVERASLRYLDALARFHFRRSEFAQAVAICRDLQARYPSYSSHRYLLFDSCAHLGWVEVAREAVSAMVGYYKAGDARLITAEMLYALGLDDEAAGLLSLAEDTDHSAALARMTLCHSAMRRGGVAQGLAAFSRAWTAPAAWPLLYGADAATQHGLKDYWQGERPLPHRLVVKGRGGAGDTLLWMRYLPALRAAGVEITQLDGRVGGIRVKDLADPEEERWARMRLSGRGQADADADADLWTDPFALFTSLFGELGYADRPGGYLDLDPDDIARDLLAQVRARAGRRPAIAITWSSDESDLFASRSLTLDQVGPLFAMNGIHWVVCQRGFQRQAFADAPGTTDATLLPTSLDFAQTGAILRGLDGVVANDGSITHLSGGLGCRTFMLASAKADWRWEAFPSFTPWYGQTRLFRQPTLGDWDGAVASLRVALAAWTGDGR